MAAVGVDHEQRLAAQGVRKGLGAYYTPPDVVGGLLDLALAPILAARSRGGVEAVAATRVLDPACGTGNVLVAAVERIAGALRELGLDPVDADRRAVRCVRGIELDGGTARVCRANLRAIHADGGGRSIVRGDALLDPGLVPAGAFDLVIGNPPFLSQLSSSTVRSREDADRLRARFGSAVGPYTDPAAVFLLRSLEAARPDGGVVALIEPLAVLSARDARGVRARALADASLAALWVAEEPVFDADVEVCAPVLVRGGVGGATSIVRGRSFSSGPTVAAPDAAAPSWSSLLAALQDLPVRSLRTDGLLGDLADATADFRDQYYGLADAVVDEAVSDVARTGDHPRLVTSGLIDPARLLWGERACRFNRVAYEHPRVVLDRLSPPLRAWAGRRLVPKVLVATQTRVLEAVVDEAGGLLPSVPVLTVSARSGRADDLWRIGALLCAPPATLVAARRHLGAGRNATALRLAASDVLALPLPAGREPWDRAAGAFEQASAAEAQAQRNDLLHRCAHLMCEAYGLEDDGELVAWWSARLPRPRTAAPGP
jgi:SAM-dependent methyltransferase